MRGRLPVHARVFVACLVALLLAAACSSGGGELSFESRSVRDRRRTAPAGADEPLVQGGLLPGAGGGNRDSGTGARSDEPGGGTPGQQQGGGPGGETDSGPKSVIKLGTVLPLQGGQRDFGEPILRTTQAFIDEINARGGVNGHPLQLVAYNACLVCQSDARDAVRRLVEQDHVFALVNTYVEVVSFIPVIPYLEEKGVPLIQGGSYNQTSDALSPINFATAPTGLFYGRFLPVMTARFAKVKRVGITHLDVPSERNGIDLLRRELEREGVEVVAVESIEAAEEAVTNMDSVVTRIRARGADGVLALNPVLLIYGRLAAKRQSFEVPWVGPAAWSPLVESGCGATCDNLVWTETAGLSYTDRQSPQMRQFLDTMARRYPGGGTTGHTLAAWVGMQLLVEVLARVGEPDRAAFLAEMNNVRNVDLGTTSPLTFTPDRHLGGSQSTIIKLRNGRYFRFSDPLSFGEAADS
jgi:branched-chain amino acid transport system substrate-binding protein